MNQSMLWYTFFIYAIMYIILYYKSRFTYYSLFLCLSMEHEKLECQREFEKENICLDSYWSRSFWEFFWESCRKKLCNKLAKD
jgi:hypothetical protein